MFPLRDLEFLFEIGSLRHMCRGWRQHVATECASDLEHTMRVAFLALLLARRSGEQVDEELLLKMALVHDLAETRVSDLSYVQKVYVKADEPRAVHDLFDKTSVSDLEEIVARFERRDSIEAKLVKDADNLDVDLEIKELEEKGSQLAKKWQPTRRFVRDEKLYTEVAKECWDAIQTSDPASWHLNANKWIHLPEER